MDLAGRDSVPRRGPVRAHGAETGDEDLGLACFGLAWLDLARVRQDFGWIWLGVGFGFDSWFGLVLAWQSLVILSSP